MNAHYPKGGVVAHFARRLFHIISIIGVVFLYYWFFPSTSTDPASTYFLISIFIAVIIFEIIRMQKRWIFFGQRSYEATQISAFAWTVAALCMLLLFSPSKNAAMAIAISCAVGDPLLGELRAKNVNPIVAMFIAACCLFVIWLLFHFSITIAIVMAIVTVLVEKPTFKWIDDNALMLLVPLMLLHFL